MEMVVPRYLHCSTIGIFDLPRKKDGELTFNSIPLKHKENDLDPNSHYITITSGVSKVLRHTFKCLKQ